MNEHIILNTMLFEFLTETNSSIDLRINGQAGIYLIPLLNLEMDLDIHTIEIYEL